MGASSSVVCGRCGTTFQTELALSTHLETCAVLVHVQGAQLDVKSTGDIMVKTVECMKSNRLTSSE